MNKSYDVAQNIFRCRSPPSLECIALTRIAISLWQQHDVRDEIIHSLDPNILFMYIDSVMHLHRVWREKIEKKVLAKVPQLLLPKCWTEVLEGTVKAIGGQVLAFLSSPDQLSISFYEKVKIYLDNICWTMRGTVNNLKTASLLVQDSNVSTEEKYILACNNCLDGKVRDLHGKLHNDFLNDFIDENKFRLVLFWTYHVQGEDKKFSEIICQGIVFGFNNNKYILRWAMENKNEVAAKYILENFSDSEMKERVVDFAEVALRWPALIDTTFYLFSQMNQGQIEEVCVRKGYVLLVTLTNSWRWHDFLIPVAMYVLKFIRKMNFWDALEIIIFCWEEDILQRDQFISILNEFISFFANVIKLNFKEICEKLSIPVFSMEDVETIESLIRKGTFHDRKRFLYDDFGMKQCSELIINNKYELLAVFIQETLATAEDIDQFKKHFFRMRSFKICLHLVIKDKYEILDEFLLMFCTEEEICNFKYKLLYGDEKIISDILRNVTYIDSNPLAMVDRFLSWCFEGMGACMLENDILSGCRGMIVRHILTLSKKREWQLVEKYLKWTMLMEYKICKCKVKKLRCTTQMWVNSENEDHLIKQK